MPSLNPATRPNTPRANAAERAAERTRRENSFVIEGLSGPAELRTHPLGFRQVWPRPSAEELKQFYGEQFYDTARPEYLEKMERDRSFWDATWSLRRSLMEAALPSDRRRLFDVGASGGFLLDHFHRHGWSVAGVEPSRSAVDWAKREHGIEIFCGELLDYPDPAVAESSSPNQGASEGLFDAVHSAQVLEHVLEPEACVERIASLLAPGGIAFIEIPNDFNSMQEAARDDLGKSSWWVAPEFHLNYFDADSLSALLASNGLVEIDRLASFPMELFLLMGEDYVGHPEVGSACHAKRMRFEETLFAEDRSETLLRFYRALGQASLGRTCGILARKVG